MAHDDEPPLSNSGNLTTSAEMGNCTTNASRNPYQIFVSNRQESLDVDEAFLKKIARVTLSEEEIVQAEISLVLLEHEEMRELNRQFLQHDYTTDVLSFLLECQPEPNDAPAASRIPYGQGKRIEGEVVLCTAMAKEMAPRFHWSPLEELALYLIHGLLHLAGYDDLSEEELPIMKQREREVLKILNIDPPANVSS